MYFANCRNLGVAVAFLALSGCSDGRPKDALPTKPVTVSVTHNGAPVEGAIVTFIHETAPAFGRTDAQGVARMTTYVDGDGAVHGTHTVTINKAEARGGAPETDYDSPEYDPVLADHAETTVEYLVPQKYSSPATSDLTVTISDTSESTVSFDLTD